MAGHKPESPWLGLYIDAKNTLTEIFDPAIPFHTSPSEVVSLQAWHGSHMQPKVVLNTSSFWPQSQSGPQMDMKTDISTRQRTNEISKLPTITEPTISTLDFQTLLQKAKRCQKCSPSCSPTSAPSSTSLKRWVPNCHTPPRKIERKAIEKRYRTNSNKKYALLQDSISSLDIEEEGISNRKTAMQSPDTRQDMRKAAILSNAIKHISRLESHNARLAREYQEVKSQIDAFECLHCVKAGSISVLGLCLDVKSIHLTGEEGRKKQL